eukprot:COSAG02_NODE_6353_length_3629_cov_9.103683_5_plen_113_part_00
MSADNGQIISNPRSGAKSTYSAGVRQRHEAGLRILNATSLAGVSPYLRGRTGRYVPQTPLGAVLHASDRRGSASTSRRDTKQRLQILSGGVGARDGALARRTERRHTRLLRI